MSRNIDAHTFLNGLKDDYLHYETSAKFHFEDFPDTFKLKDFFKSMKKE